MFYKHFWKNFKEKFRFFSLGLFSEDVAAVRRIGQQEAEAVVGFAQKLREMNLKDRRVERYWKELQLERKIVNRIKMS